MIAPVSHSPGWARGLAIYQSVGLATISMVGAMTRNSAIAAGLHTVAASCGTDRELCPRTLHSGETNSKRLDVKKVLTAFRAVGLRSSAVSGQRGRPSWPGRESNRRKR